MIFVDLKTFIIPRRLSDGHLSLFDWFFGVAAVKSLLSPTDVSPPRRFFYGRMQGVAFLLFMSSPLNSRFSSSPAFPPPSRLSLNALLETAPYEFGAGIPPHLPAESIVVLGQMGTQRPHGLPPTPPPNLCPVPPDILWASLSVNRPCDELSNPPCRLSGLLLIGASLITPPIGVTSIRDSKSIFLFSFFSHAGSYVMRTLPAAEPFSSDCTPFPRIPLSPLLIPMGPLPYSAW